MTRLFAVSITLLSLCGLELHGALAYWFDLFVSHSFFTLALLALAFRMCSHSSRYRRWASLMVVPVVLL